MKIIHLIYSMHQGGAERFVVDLANEQYLRGNDVTVATILDLTAQKELSFNAQFINPGVKLTSLGLRPGFSIKKVLHVSKWIKTQKADIVNCHLNVIPYIFPLALRHGKTRFFHTIHSVAKYASGLNSQFRINRWFYRTGRIVPICISNECLLSFEGYYGLQNVPKIDNGRSQVLPTNSLDLVKQEVGNYKDDERTPVFIHVARCHPSKNQRLLIEAFNKLDKEGYDYVLLIIGGGFDENGQELKDLACGKIKFLGLKSNVGDYLLCSDAFCLSSEYEGLPISLLEAMSVGVVPICTAVGGIKDVVEDGKTGFLSRTLNIDDYVETIKRFLDNQLNRSLIIKNFNDSFSMKKCEKEYSTLYYKWKFSEGVVWK